MGPAKTGHYRHAQYVDGYLKYPSPNGAKVSGPETTSIKALRIPLQTSLESSNPSPNFLPSPKVSADTRLSSYLTRRGVVWTRLLEGTHGLASFPDSLMTNLISDPNESQATQLLNDLLQNETDSSRKPSDAHNLNSRSVHSNEISSDSLPSPRHSNSLPQYHFHGLAATQTQSQHYEQGEEVNEGWPKKNIGAQRPSPPAGSTSKGAQGTEAYTEITVVNFHRVCGIFF